MDYFCITTEKPLNFLKAHSEVTGSPQAFLNHDGCQEGNNSSFCFQNASVIPFCWLSCRDSFVLMFKICEVASTSQAVKYSQMSFLVRVRCVPVPLLWHEMFLFSLCLIAVNRIRWSFCGSHQGVGSRSSHVPLATLCASHVTEPQPHHTHHVPIKTRT